MARSSARAVRGARGMVTVMPPLRCTTRVRWPRSRPSWSMSAPSASETRSPLRAGNEPAGWTVRRRRGTLRARCDRARRRGTRRRAEVAGHGLLGSARWRPRSGDQQCPPGRGTLSTGTDPWVPSSGATSPTAATSRRHRRCPPLLRRSRCRRTSWSRSGSSSGPRLSSRSCRRWA